MPLAIDIRQQLYLLQDEDYALFQRKLLPTVNPTSIIGVRTPALRNFAKQLSKEKSISDFLLSLPHSTFEENQIHAFIISTICGFSNCIVEVERFLPFIDNWATCDQLSPKIFKKHREELFIHINKWLHSNHEYTIRFAIGMLLEHYLDETFSPSHLSLVASVKREEYYIRMMQAWYIATALAKQYKATIIYLQTPQFDRWVHNKAIQKAIESRRITDEQKQYLRTLKQ